MNSLIFSFAILDRDQEYYKLAPLSHRLSTCVGETSISHKGHTVLNGQSYKDKKNTTALLYQV